MADSALGWSRLLLLGFGLTLVGGGGCGRRLPDYIPPHHGAILGRWLAAHGTFRVARDEDCSCEPDIANVRRGYGEGWEGVPDYHPYYAAGDFNWDGAEDFCVAVVGSDPGLFAIVIFNGPLTGDHDAEAAYFGGSFPLGQAIFHGPPNLEPKTLLVGPFESEGLILWPTPDGYVGEYPED